MNIYKSNKVYAVFRLPTEYTNWVNLMCNKNNTKQDNFVKYIINYCIYYEKDFIRFLNTYNKKSNEMIREKDLHKLGAYISKVEEDYIKKFLKLSRKNMSCSDLYKYAIEFIKQKSTVLINDAEEYDFNLAI